MHSACSAGLTDVCWVDVEAAACALLAQQQQRGAPAVHEPHHEGVHPPLQVLPLPQLQGARARGGQMTGDVKLDSSEWTPRCLLQLRRCGTGRCGAAGRHAGGAWCVWYMVCREGTRSGAVLTIVPPCLLPPAHRRQRTTGWPLTCHTSRHSRACALVRLRVLGYFVLNLSAPAAGASRRRWRIPVAASCVLAADRVMHCQRRCPGPGCRQ